MFKRFLTFVLVILIVLPIILRYRLASLVGMYNPELGLVLYTFIVSVIDPAINYLMGGIASTSSAAGSGNDLTQSLAEKYVQPTFWIALVGTILFVYLVFSAISGGAGGILKGFSSSLGLLAGLKDAVTLKLILSLLMGFSLVLSWEMRESLSTNGVPLLIVFGTFVCLELTLSMFGNRSSSALLKMGTFAIQVVLGLSLLVLVFGMITPPEVYSESDLTASLTSLAATTSGVQGLTLEKVITTVLSTSGRIYGFGHETLGRSLKPDIRALGSLYLITVFVFLLTTTGIFSTKQQEEE